MRTRYEYVYVLYKNKHASVEVGKTIGRWRDSALKSVKFDGPFGGRFFRLAYRH